MDALEDAVNASEQLEIVRNSQDQEGLSSPIASHILDFGDDERDLFAETLGNSDVSSSSINGCGRHGDSGAGISSGGQLAGYDDNKSLTSTELSPFPSMDLATLSTLLDPETFPKLEPDMASSFACPSEDYPAPNFSEQQDQLVEVVLADEIVNGRSVYSTTQPQLTPVYEGECMAAFGGLDAAPMPSCSLIDPEMSTFYAGSSMSMSLTLCGEGQGFFPAGMAMNMHPGLAEYERAEAGGAAIYMLELMQQGFSTTGDTQVAGDNQQMVITGCGSPTTLVSEIPAMDDSGINKVGRLSAEERKEKIQRYMRKRNQRNFSKKIKYACRKTLADSRPRVRGRFAKNDELGEVTRPSSNCHDFDDDEVVVKEVDDILDSSDILAHISGLNSFKYNYSLESWT